MVCSCFSVTNKENSNIHQLETAGWIGTMSSHAAHEGPEKAFLPYQRNPDVVNSGTLVSINPLDVST